MADRTEAESVIVWEDVKLTAYLEHEVSKFNPAGLANISEAAQAYILEEANDEVIYLRWGPKRTFHGRRYYAAHKAMLAVTGAAGKGSHSGESIGSISVSDTMAVNNPDAMNGMLETHFGRQWYELQKKVKRSMDIAHVG